jgi:hypothetical protein
MIGEWRGEGAGMYPRVEDFSYRETAIYFAPPGKAFIVYRQQTWRTGDHPESGRPLHTESGYLRPAGDGAVEMVLAQPTGIVEVLDGRVTDNTIALQSTTVARTATAKDVTSVERILTVDGNRMTYRLLMAAVGRQHQLHLEATLDRHS